MKTVYKEGTNLLDYRQIEAFQGELKDLPKAEYQKLLNSFNKHGFFVPMFIWQNDGHNYLLDGHGRLRILTNEQIEFENTGYEVPVVLIEADNIKDAKEKLLKITSQYQKITQEGLDAYIAQAELPEAEIYQAVSFDALPLLGSSEEPEAEEDEAPDVDEGGVASSVLGTVYQLGRHRIMCGDSTVKENVELLMNGEKADMVFTDPPYGVDYSGLGQNTKNKIENDALSIEDTEDMVSKALANAYDASREGTTCFVWHADSKPELRPLFERSFIKAGWRLSATIIWLKKQASMGFQDYRSRHEPCLYGWKGKREDRVKDRTQTTVWESGRDSNYEHPTQKPVFLAANAINNHNPGIILDLFLGSGSTLIACEQTNRTCYGMELDPKYVDVIRKRWAKFVYPDRWEQEWESLTPAVNNTGILQG